MRGHRHPHMPIPHPRTPIPHWCIPIRGQRGTSGRVCGTGLCSGGTGPAARLILLPQLQILLPLRKAVSRWLAARSFAAAALIVAYAVRLHDDVTDQAMADGGRIEKAAGLAASKIFVSSANAPEMFDARKEALDQIGVIVQMV
jgi:hypothetical protein